MGLHSSIFYNFLENAYIIYRLHVRISIFENTKNYSMQIE